MSALPTDDLMKALINKISLVLTGFSDEVQIPRYRFISWVVPGLPFTPEEFDFLKGTQGLPTEEVALRDEQEFVLSKLLDLIPDLPPVNDGNNDFVNSEKIAQSMFVSTGDTISSVWRDVLFMCRVAHFELSENNKKTLEDAKKIIFDKAIRDSYKEGFAEYQDALREKANVQTSAQTAKGDSPEALAAFNKWKNEEPLLTRKVSMALNDWNSFGRRADYEGAQNRMNTITLNSMVDYKEALRQRLLSRIKGPGADPINGIGGYYPIKLVPIGFAKSPSWTKFKYLKEDTETTNTEVTRKWGANVGLRWKLNLGGKGESERKEITGHEHITNFSAAFEITQCIILRDWMEPGFFTMRSWDVNDLWINSFDRKVSDGAERPQGRLIAYSTNAVFIRNVELTFDEAEQFEKTIDDKVAGGGNVAWGLFCMGGNYSKHTTTNEVKKSRTENTLKIEGMQLIALQNAFVPKAPNLNPNLKPEDLIG